MMIWFFPFWFCSTWSIHMRNSSMCSWSWMYTVWCEKEWACYRCTIPSCAPIPLLLQSHNNNPKADLLKNGAEQLVVGVRFQEVFLSFFLKAIPPCTADWVQLQNQLNQPKLGSGNMWQELLKLAVLSGSCNVSPHLCSVSIFSFMR